MLSVNYKAINSILEDRMKENKIKNKSQMLVRLSVDMEVSFQRCWTLIEKKKINNIKQLNALAKALGVDVVEIITIEPRVPITLIH